MSSSDIIVESTTPVKSSGSANEFVIDYAKLGSSKCKNSKCLQGKENIKIAKGSLRINKISEGNPFHGGDGQMNSYFHAPCIFEQFKRARAGTKVLDNLSELQGMEKLSVPDQQTITTLFNNYQSFKNGGKVAQLKSATTTTSSSTTVTKASKRKQSESDEEQVAPVSKKSKTKKPQTIQYNMTSFIVPPGCK